MFKKFFLIVGSLLPAILMQAQDIDYTRETIRKLASAEMHGRGYVKKGDRKAARYIRGEFRKHDLEKTGKSYFHDFRFSINSFPKNMELKVNGDILEPMRDYVVYASSPGKKGSFDVVYLPGEELNSKEIKDFIDKHDLSSSFLLTSKANKDSVEKYLPAGLEGVVWLTQNKIFWHVSRGRKLKEYMSIDLKSGIKEPEKINEIYIDAPNKFLDLYKTQNVLAYVEGSKTPDKYLMFTAHYDHLGSMGKGNFFPGANDNASGVAMMLDLAKYYSKPENRPEYSILFAAFAGEEAGLLGSFYFVNYPSVPTGDILFALNLDMVGSGSEGITVVNASVFEDEFERLKQINDEKNYLKEVKPRGEACNSDHCPLYNKGIPAFFIYTRGKEFTEYHNPDDLAEELPLTEYEDLHSLITDFVKTF